MFELLLQTKLFRPSLRPSLISRPRLIQKLNGGQDSKLTLILAPAGFGKTTLASSWLSQMKGPSVWISLDQDDNDPVQFFTYAAAAVQQVEGVSNELQVLLRSSQPVSPKVLATALINDSSAATAPFILAFDDYHVISDPAIQEAVTFLLDFLPSQLHLLITSRTDPLLPLSRLRARGQLTELRTEDLRFSDTEAAAFLRQLMGLNLTTNQVAALETRTEGWIAGLQMAALSLQGMTREAEIINFITDFSGSNRYIFDYLTDEVLAQRPPETQSFLLQTAILDRFNAELCTAVTGNPESQSVLDALDRANLFLFPLDNNRQWYRYHPLFQDLLQHRLSQRPQEERNKLHKQAALWFESNEIVDQAIRHFKEADDQASIARLVRQHGSEALQPGQLFRLQRWLDSLPSEQVQSDAWLAIFQAWIYYFEQKTEQVAIWVDQAQDQLSSSGGSLQKNDAQLLGNLIGLRSWLANQQGDFERAVQLAEQALAILPETTPVWRGVVYIFLGQALFGIRRTAEAIVAYENSLQHNNELGNWVATSAITDAIVMTLVFRARLNQARVLFDRSIATITNLGQTLNASGLRMARLAILYEQNDLAAIGPELSDLQKIAQYDVGIATGRYQYFSAIYLTAIGERERAMSTLQIMEESISSWSTPDEQARAVAAIMRIYLRLGNRQKPFEWLQSITIDRSNLTLLRMTEYLAMADILRFSDSQEGHREGLRLIEATHKLCDDAEMVGFKIEVYCLQALLLAATHDEKGALDAIRHALTLAKPERYVRTFVDLGQQMASLLKKAIMSNIHPGYGEFLLAQFSKEVDPKRASTKQHIALESLSAREMEVLALLATYLTGPEIANHLHISINTYKTHTKNIYSKLSVSSRAAAVTQAQELGLLPS